MCSVSMTYAQMQCKAVTKKGYQCSRKAVYNGLCKQHYKESLRLLNTPTINLPEEWRAISIDSLHPDKMRAWRDPKANIIHLSYK